MDNKVFELQFHYEKSSTLHKEVMTLSILVYLYHCRIRFPMQDLSAMGFKHFFR